MRYFKLLACLALLATVLIGCGNDDNGTNPGDNNTNSTTWDKTNGYWVTELDASDPSQFAYYSFATRDIVSLTASEAKTSNAWDLAFSYLDVRSNSGESGAKGVVGVDLTALGEVDTLGYMNITAADTIGLSASAWTSDYYDYVIDNYFRLGPGFQVEMTRYVYDMKDAIGRYFKLQFLSIVGGGAPPAMGTITFRYAYQPIAGNTDLSIVPDTFVVDGQSGTFYFDFSDGDTVRPADPANSLDWDIYVNHYTVKLNSGLFGPGQTAGNPIFENTDVVDSTNFDGYSIAAAQPQSYSQDKIGSVFSKLDTWYRYWINDGHKITSAKHSYVVKSGGKLYKLYIAGWKGLSGDASGHFVFNWVEL